MEKASKYSITALILGLFVIAIALVILLWEKNSVESEQKEDLIEEKGVHPSHMSALFTSSTIITHRSFEIASFQHGSSQNTVLFVDQNSHSLRKLNTTSLDGADPFGV